MTSRYVAMAAVVCACSSTPPTNDAGADASTGSSVTILVVDLSFYGPLAPNVPIGGATVTIDKPGGDHEEKTADSEGKVTFTGIDWSLGTASFVAYAPGHGAYGVVGAKPENFSLFNGGAYRAQCDVLLFPYPQTTALPVSMTTTLANKALPDDHVVVGGTNTFTFVDSSASLVALSATPSAPFSLVAFEYTPGSPSSAQETALTPLRFARFDETAASVPSTPETIDVGAGGTTLVPSTAHQNVVITGGANGPLAAAHLYTIVSSIESNFALFLGALVTSSLAADQGSFDTTTEFCALAGQSPVTTYELYLGGALTLQTLFSAPADGTIDGFLAPMIPTYKTHSIDDPFDLSTAPVGTMSSLHVIDKNTVPELVIVAPPGMTSLQVPKLPDAARAQLASSHGTTATLQSYSDLNESYLIFTHTASSTSFNVTTP